MATTGEFVLNTVIRPKMAELEEKGANEADWTALLLMPALRAAAGQYAFQEFMDANDLWAKIPKLSKGIEVNAKAIEGMSSTADAVKAAKGVIKAMIEEEPPAPPAPSEPEDDDDSGEGTPPPAAEDDAATPPPAAPAPDEEKDDEGSKPEDEEPKTPESKPEDDGEPETGEGEPEPEAGEGEPEAEAEDVGMGTDGEGEGEGHDPSGKVNDQEADGELQDGHGETSGSDALSTIDREGANDYDDTLSREISKTAADSASAAEYIVYTTDHDKVETLRVGGGFRSEMLTALESKVEGMAGPMQKDLERAIVARSRARWEGGRRTGRLNAAALSRLAVGDDRVFRKKQESNSKDVAVSLVIDASGSMYGSKIHTAAASAFALSQVLDRLKISHEVICFTTGEMDRKLNAEAEAEAKKLGIRYSRLEPLYMPVVKHFHERLATDVKNRFAWLPNSRFLANNVDGECVMIAAQRLAMRKESGKAMIVLSDGAPACYGDSRAVSKHLRDTVKKIEKGGINVIGIGIESSDVTRYYSKSLVINSVDELPKRVIGELRKLLLQQ